MGWKRRRKSKRKQSAEQDIDKESGRKLLHWQATPM